MRLLLVGAFPYPHHQGSQVYFQEQAIALRSAGAEICLLTYASPEDPAQTKRGGRRAPESWRALDGFEHWTSPRWSSPRSLRAGPSWAKPLGDLGLAVTLRDALTSSRHRNGFDAFDAILTHNAEATLVALHTLPRPRPPILYCAHTLLGNELSAYLKGPKKKGILGLFDIFRASGTLTRGLDRFGGGIDGWLAKRVDGWLALTQSSERVMRQFSRAPGLLLAPPLPDPELSPVPLKPAEVARRHGLEPGRFFIYSGNLDAYQELDILAAAAVDLAGRSESPPPLVVASHPMGETRSETHSDAPVESMPGVRFCEVESVAEMQGLISAARASLVTRRAEGGFPIKLVNSLALGTPVIAFRDREWGLTHQRNSLICAPKRPVPTLADAIDRLANDDTLAKRLADGARALYLERHRPEHVASQTLALIREIGRFRQSV